MNKTAIHRNIITVALLAMMAVSFSGCFWIVLGASAAGGYAISQDTIQGESQKEYEEVWRATTDIVSVLGTVTSESRELGKVIAIVDGAKVTINVIQLTSTTTRLKVKARRALFPSISTAQNLYIKIMNRADQAR